MKGRQDAMLEAENERKQQRSTIFRPATFQFQYVFLTITAVQFSKR
jgi:hypothetical protein